MKFSSYFAVCTLLVISNISQAAQIYLTFTGEVTEIVVDYAGIVESSGVSVGDFVEYTYVVDFDIPGSNTAYNGSVTTYGDWIQTNNLYNYGWKESFYSELISGSIIESINGGTRNGPDNWEHVNAGVMFNADYVNESYNDFSYIAIHGDSENDLTQIYLKSDYGMTIADYLTIGNIFEGSEHAFDDLNNVSGFKSSLTLTKIIPELPDLGPFPGPLPPPPSSPIPLPPALWLFSSSLIGFLWKMQTKHTKYNET